MCIYPYKYSGTLQAVIHGIDSTSISTSISISIPIPTSHIHFARHSGALSQSIDMTQQQANVPAIPSPFVLLHFCILIKYLKALAFVSPTAGARQILNNFIPFLQSHRRLPPAPTLSSCQPGHPAFLTNCTHSGNFKIMVCCILNTNYTPKALTHRAQRNS